MFFYGTKGRIFIIILKSHNKVSGYLLSFIKYVYKCVIRNNIIIENNFIIYLPK